MLEVRLLGPPEITCEGAALSFPTRKALALFVYLVVEGGRQPRDELASFLWPESDPGRVRATLRNCLYQTRSALPEGYLIVEGEVVGFDFSADYTLDLEELAEAANMPPLSPAAGSEAARPQRAAWQNAVELWRGEFLAGFSLGDAPEFDNWAGLERERWFRRMDIVYNRLSQFQFDQGQMSAALRTAEQWRRHNPINETVYRRLMRLHMAAGERTAALQSYEKCREMLNAELGVEPSPRTRALAARLETAERTTVERRRPSPAGVVNFSQGPFVGREGAFGALAAAYRRTAADGFRTAAVVGEAGIGKTRLAEEFVAWSEAQGAAVLHGRSFESGRQLPYQPLVDALRASIEAINAPDDLLSDTWLLELSRLLPELLDRYPDLLDISKPKREESAARSRLFEAVVRLTLALAERLPPDAALIFFLDDLQWADGASFDLLQYAARRWQEQATPILMLATVRSGALDGRSPVYAPELAGCLSGLERLAPLSRIELAALSPGETVGFLQTLGVEENGRFARWLFEQTDGQPFYMVETLNDLLERGLVSAAGDGRLRPAAGVVWDIDPVAVPEKVRGMIAGRLARLGRDAQEMAAAGSVLARGFDFERLRQVAGLDEGAGLRALDELLYSQLLRERPEETAVPYLFAHDKIREVVYEAAGAARRRVFHKRALAALWKAGGPAGELARHAKEAGDDEAAFTYSLAAGREALALFAAREAAANLEQARQLRERTPAAGRERLRELYLSLGRAKELMGDYDGALAVYDELQEAARKTADKPLELAALMARTTVYAAPTQHYDPQQVTILTEQALPLARELEDFAAESKILWNLMLLKLFTGELEAAVADGEASLAIAREYGLRERAAYALHDLLRAYLFSGRMEEGLEAAHEAQALWRKLDNKAMLADNLIGTAGSVNFMQGEYGKAIGPLREALALSREIDNLWNQSFAYHNLGSVYFMLGRFGEAIEACEAAVEIGMQAGFMIPLFVNGSILALIYGMAGRPDLGLPYVEKALAVAEKSRMRDQRAAPLAAMAFIHMCRGEMEAAADYLAQSYKMMEPDSLSAGVFFTYPVDGRFRLQTEEYGQALEVGERMLAHLKRTRLRVFLPDAYYFKGGGLVGLGRLEEGREALEQALEQAERQEARPILWEILAALAALEEGEEAEELKGDAAEVVENIADGLPGVLGKGFLEQVKALPIRLTQT